MSENSAHCIVNHLEQIDYTLYCKKPELHNLTSYNYSFQAEKMVVTLSWIATCFQ